MKSGPVAEIAFDLSFSADKMRARLYAPEQDSEGADWSCAFEIDAPVSVRRTIYGVSSLQALVLGLKTMSAYLYGSEAYKNKQFGLGEEFGGDLSLPAPSAFLGDAPYPF